MRAQVVIIGSGPSGLLLGQLLAAHRHRQRHPRAAEPRTCAGPHPRRRAGAGHGRAARRGRRRRAAARRGPARMTASRLAFDSRLHRIDLDAADRRQDMSPIYGQTEVTRDLMDARKAAGLHHDLSRPPTSRRMTSTADRRASPTSRTASPTRSPATSSPAATAFTASAAPASVPAAIKTFERRLSVRLARASSPKSPPADHELIYANHARGFALCSMRSTHRSRYYVQCPLDDHVEDWSDERFWDELRRRLRPDRRPTTVVTGPSFEKIDRAAAQLRRRADAVRPLFLAGDAAHIVPPTGAKGLNLAASDVRYLSRRSREFYRREIAPPGSTPIRRRRWRGSGRRCASPGG